MLDERQIEALQAVVTEGSFLGAARQLHLTPAAVTQRVKALEAAIGALVLVRGRHLRLTPQGQALLAYRQKADWLREDLLRSLDLDVQTYRGNKRWRHLRVAVNADSVATWFLPGVAQMLARHHLLLDVLIDDQDFTHEALRSGEVIGCVTTHRKALSGCVCEPLGVMRYRCMAHKDLLAKIQASSGKPTAHRLLQQPAVIFNRKDALQELFLEKYFGLRAVPYPKHFVPALDAFEQAIRLGLGWGMMPDIPQGRLADMTELEDVLPDAHIDVALYWQHWERQPPQAAALSQAVKTAAQLALRQTVVS